MDDTSNGSRAPFLDYRAWFTKDTPVLRRAIHLESASYQGTEDEAEARATWAQLGCHVTKDIHKGMTHPLRSSDSTSMICRSVRMMGRKTAWHEWTFRPGCPLAMSSPLIIRVNSSPVELETRRPSRHVPGSLCYFARYRRSLRMGQHPVRLQQSDIPMQYLRRLPQRSLQPTDDPVQGSPADRFQSVYVVKEGRGQNPSPLLGRAPVKIARPMLDSLSRFNELLRAPLACVGTDEMHLAVTGSNRLPFHGNKPAEPSSPVYRSWNECATCRLSVFDGVSQTCMRMLRGGKRRVSAGMTMIMEELRKELTRHCKCSAMGGPKYLNNLDAAPLPHPQPGLESLHDFVMGTKRRYQQMPWLVLSNPGFLVKITIALHKGHSLVHASTRPHSLQAKARFAASFTVREPTSSRSVIFTFSGSSQETPCQNASHRWKIVSELWRLWLRRYPDTPTRQKLIELSMSLFIQKT
ncbi:hypothetical protein LA080_012807 [Diaporthe eres]|nr:hypothetical protein LA080_012807 [Diaporthe eres]